MDEGVPCKPKVVILERIKLIFHTRVHTRVHPLKDRILRVHGSPS